MDTILSTGSQLAKGVDTILGYVRVTWGNTSLGHGLQQTHLVEHSQNYEGRRDADDASPGHEIRGSRGESRGDEDGTQKNQSTTLFNTDQHTADGPNVHAEERTRGRNEAALVTTGECDGHNKCIASGYHFAITADGTNTKIIYESTAPEDLQVVVRGKEGQQTFSFTASSEKEIGYETPKPTLPIAVKAKKVGAVEEEENANVTTTEEEHEEEQTEDEENVEEENLGVMILEEEQEKAQEEDQEEEQEDEQKEEKQDEEHAPPTSTSEPPACDNFGAAAVLLDEKSDKEGNKEDNTAVGETISTGKKQKEDQEEEPFPGESFVIQWWRQSKTYDSAVCGYVFNDPD